MRPIQLSSSPRILISRTDRIGDVVLSTPVFSAIKQKYPKAFVAAMVLQGTAPIVRGNPWIDEVIILDKNGRHKSWFQTFLLGLSLRRYQFGIAIHLHPTNRVNVITWAAGIPIRIGYKVLLGNHGKNDFLLTHKILERKWQGKKHEAEYNFDLLKLIQVPIPEQLKLHFPLVQQDLNDLINFIPPELRNRYVVFHPSASCVSKRWPPERLAQVADRLSSQYGILPVLIGEGEGIEHVREMQSKMKEKSLNLAGKLSLGMLGWLLKGARLLVSNDSGPVHLAAALETPVVSIFGRNQPGLGPVRWRPISKRASYIQKEVGCVVCLAHNCEINFKCLTELLVDDVLDVIKPYEPLLV